MAPCFGVALYLTNVLVSATLALLARADGPEPDGGTVEPRRLEA